MLVTGYWVLEAYGQLIGYGFPRKRIVQKAQGGAHYLSHVTYIIHKVPLYYYIASAPFPSLILQHPYQPYLYLSLNVSPNSICLY